MAWTIEHVEGSLDQSFEAWGIDRAQRSLVSQGADTLRISEAGGSYDTAALFDFDDTLILKEGSTRRFVGRVGGSRRIADERGEYREYTIYGPWSWLDQMVYQQSWKTTSGASATLVAMNKSRVVIGQDAAGAKVATGAEMTTAINWAITNGAAITLGTIDAGVTIPYQEVTDITVAELIRLCLRWTPDAAVWFDYTTTPNPTIHITRRADLTDLSIAVSPTLAQSLDIVPRDDLTVPAVAIHYEQGNVVDGVTYNETTSDIYPISATGAEPRAVVATIDLVGGSSTNEKQAVKTDVISPGSKAFWKKHHPAIRNYADGDLTITGGSVLEYDSGGSPVTSALTRYLEEGTLSDWMGETSKPVFARALITYEGSAGDDFTDKEFTVDLTGTTASKSLYSRLVSSAPGEGAPSGLAEALYDALSVLHWQGSFTKLESEVAGDAHPGKKLNLTGGLAAWATMNAMIQGVSEDIGSGKTTITFGPPEHLGPSDLVEMLRASRGARSTWRLNERTTAVKAADGGQVEGPKHTVKQNASIAPGGDGGGSPGDEFAMTVCVSGSPVLKTFYVKP